MRGDMGRTYDTITFLSDFGMVDESVGVVRSVIREIAPQAHVLDLTHGIEAYDVRGASLALARSVSYLCAGVVMAVVDPGVGTARRAIAVEVGDGISVLLGPDNGILAPAASICGGAGRAVELNNPAFQLEAPGPTFAGRDVFAPAAAHLANGVDLAELGTIIDAGSLLPGLVPLTRDEDGEIHAEVLWVDRFGNCQLNVDPDEVAAFGDRFKVTITGTHDAGHAGRSRIVQRVVAFDDVPAGALGVHIDAHGLLAIIMSRTSAAEELEVGAGAGVVLSALA